MSFYINRIKYKGGSPRLGTSSGIINNAIINGYSFYDEYNQTPEIDYSQEYFTIESLEDGNVITFTIPASFSSSYLSSISYSTDNGSTWTTTTNDGTAKTISVNLDEGDKVLWKGSGIRIGYNGNSYCKFTSTKTFNVYGNIMSLLHGDNFYEQKTFTTWTQYNFISLLSGTDVVDASNFVLPATTLIRGCYYQMFYNCSSLVNAPKLPATTLANECYGYMFEGTAIVEPPELPATTVAQDCYWRMFRNCSSLIKAPELKATTLVTKCYRLMFVGCTSLTEAPELPATTLVEQCYYQMFYGCSNLNYIKCLATDISANDCTYQWVQNVAATGNFIKADTMNDWVIDSVNGIPIGWTLHNYTE